MADAAVLQGGAATVNTDLDALQKVSPADVQRVMKRYVASAHKLALHYVQGGATAGAEKGAPK